MRAPEYCGNLRRMNGGKSSSYQALRDSEELHRATLGSISDAVFMTDDKGVFTYVCPNVDVIFGYTPDEVRAMRSIDRFLGGRLCELSELVSRGEIRNVEREVTSKSGQPRIVLMLPGQQRIAAGEEVALSFSWSDAHLFGADGLRLSAS